MTSKIHQWNFEQNGLDSHGALNGTVTGTFVADGIYGSNYSLNIDSFVEFASVPQSFTVSSKDFSVGFWVKKTGVASSETPLMTLYSNTVRLFGIYLTQDGSLKIYGQNVSGQPTYSISIDSDYITYGQEGFDSLIVSFIDATKSFEVYWNSIQIPFIDNSSMDSFNGFFTSGLDGRNNRMEIGKDTSGNNLNYLIDDFRIFLGQISLTEIEEIMNGSINGIITDTFSSNPTITGLSQTSALPFTPNIRILGNTFTDVGGTQSFDDSFNVGFSIEEVSEGTLEVMLGEYNLEDDITSTTNTEIRFKVPNIPEGEYELSLSNSAGSSNVVLFNVAYPKIFILSSPFFQAGQVYSVSGTFLSQNPHLYISGDTEIDITSNIITKSNEAITFTAPDLETRTVPYKLYVVNFGGP